MARMGKNASYHFAAIETNGGRPVAHLHDSGHDSGNAEINESDITNVRDVPSAHEAVSQVTKVSEDLSPVPSNPISCEYKGYRVEGTFKSNLIRGEIFTPAYRPVNNVSLTAKDTDDLYQQLVRYVDDLEVKIQRKFTQDLEIGDIRGNIALRIDPRLHCDLKIESTFADKTLNGLIEEILKRREFHQESAEPVSEITSKLQTPSLPVESHDETSASSLIRDQETNPAPSQRSESRAARSAVSKRLRHNQKALLEMLTVMMGAVDRDESPDLIRVTESLGEFINTLGDGVEKLSPYLDIPEGNEAALLKILSEMLSAASNALSKPSKSPE